MTVKGYGLRVVEFNREKLPNGMPDPDYTGRILRLVIESGGELEILLTAGEVRRLCAASEEAARTLTWNNAGWRNIPTNSEPSASGQNLPLSGAQSTDLNVLERTD